MPSLVAEIGDVLESHLRMIGMFKDDSLDDHQKKLIDEKRAEYESNLKNAEVNSPEDFPDGAKLCHKCSTKAVIKMDGCLTCLNCGESKCS